MTGGWRDRMDGPARQTNRATDGLMDRTYGRDWQNDRHTGPMNGVGQEGKGWS